MKQYKHLRFSGDSKCCFGKNQQQSGSLQPEGNFNAGDYSFGFNGQGMDNEISGTGNTNTNMFWEYDARLGRRWNTDPEPTTGIIENACFGNNLIVFGEKSNNFSFNSKNQLVFSGDSISFTGDEINRTIDSHGGEYVKNTTDFAVQEASGNLIHKAPFVNHSETHVDKL